jgi:hypothetical protein
MPQQDTSKIKEKIINFIKEKGPSLPVHIASSVGMSMLFTSAFLSELVSSKQLRMSYMRVGSSPIYFLEEQEDKLEDYSQYIKGKEREAYELLKEKKFLVDSEQEPAIRVALRSIKDFAKFIEEKGIWRYYLTNEKDLHQKEETKEQEIVLEKNEISKQEEIKSFNNPEREFVDRIREFIQDSKIKLIEETEIKKREFLGIGRIETDLGEMELLIIGKDKKTITEKDLIKVFELIKQYKRMVILIITGEIAKKTKELYREYKNIIFLEKI